MSCHAVSSALARHLFLITDTIHALSSPPLNLLPAVLCRLSCVQDPEVLRQTLWSSLGYSPPPTWPSSNPDQVCTGA